MDRMIQKYITMVVVLDVVIMVSDGCRKTSNDERETKIEKKKRRKHHIRE